MAHEALEWIAEIDPAGECVGRRWTRAPSPDQAARGPACHSDPDAVDHSVRDAESYEILETVDDVRPDGSISRRETVRRRL